MSGADALRVRACTTSGWGSPKVAARIDWRVFGNRASTVSDVRIIRYYVRYLRIHASIERGNCSAETFAELRWLRVRELRRGNIAGSGQLSGLLATQERNPSMLMIARGRQLQAALFRRSRIALRFVSNADRLLAEWTHPAAENRIVL